VIDRRNLPSRLSLSVLAAQLAVRGAATGEAPPNRRLFASTPAATSHLLDGLRQGLREQGYVEGPTHHLGEPVRPSRTERMSMSPPSWLHLKVDVLVAATDPATARLNRGLRQSPIVMANSTDPVGTGFVASLARPGGNVTASALSPRSSAGSGWAAEGSHPRARRVAIIWNPRRPRCSV